MRQPDILHDCIRLYHADCMDIMAQYPDKYFDLAVVDPPYGIGIVDELRNSANSSSMFQGNGLVGNGAWDNCIPSPQYFMELERVSKLRVIWGGNYFLEFLGATRCFLVWDKMNGTNPMADAELAWTDLAGSVRMFRMHHFSNGYGKKQHPTQKPVALYAWIYANYANPGMRILDTHLGSGSNAIAAHYAKMGEFVGVELDADYFKSAAERIYKETRQAELF